MSRQGKTWTFLRPSDPARVIRFEPTGEDFGAMYLAEGWLLDHGYCYGSTDGGRYVPAMKGDRYTLPQKLYNFYRKGYMKVTAVMYSCDYREGWVEVWIVEPMWVLHLFLEYRWYDMILSGEKREEYRRFCKRWNKAFTGISTEGAPLYSFRNGYQQPNVNGYTHVCLHRGYTTTTATYRINAVTIGQGRTDWGAPDGEDVYIIKLGERY